MPQEIRYLLFSNAELFQALSDSSRADGRPLPTGFLKEVILGESAPIDVMLICVTDNGVEVPIRFEQHHVISSLIGYCKRRQIPMCAQAVKTLEIRDRRIALLCTLGLKLPTSAASSRIQASVGRAQSSEGTRTERGIEGRHISQVTNPMPQRVGSARPRA
jgi:hypothetical protein